MAKRAYQKKYHFIYKTTRFDGMYYIGIHSTDDLNDGYKGSGVRIGRSLRYHGKDKHIREILEFLPSRETLIIRERQIVTQELIQNDSSCMNLHVGGRAAPFFDDETAAKIKLKVKDVWKDEERLNNMRGSVKSWWTPERRCAQSELKKKQHEDPKVIENISKALRMALSSPKAKHNLSVAKVKNWQDTQYRDKQIALQNLGKEAHAFKNSQSISQSGKNNPNFGTRWAYNETIRQNKKIHKDEILLEGWIFGRKNFKSIDKKSSCYSKIDRTTRASQHCKNISESRKGKGLGPKIGFIIKDPNNEIHIVNGYLDKFCEEHGINRKRLYSSLKLGRAIDFGTTQGWQIIETFRIPASCL